jgi:hypothetical protein
MSERTLRNPETVTMDDIMNRLIAMEVASISSKRTIENCSCNINNFGDYSAVSRCEIKLWRHEYRPIKHEKEDHRYFRIAVDRLTQQINQLRQEKIQQQLVINGFPANLTDSFLVHEVVMMAK